MGKVSEGRRFSPRSHLIIFCSLTDVQRRTWLGEREPDFGCRQTKARSSRSQKVTCPRFIKVEGSTDVCDEVPSEPPRLNGLAVRRHFDRIL